MRSGTIVGLAALLVATVGCQAAPGPNPVVSPTTVQPVATQNPSQPTPTPLPTRPASAGDVAATVNGVAIPMVTYQAQLQAAMASYAQQPGVDPNTPEGQAALGALQEQVLDWLIDQAIIDQAASQRGIKVDDAQVTAEVERIRQENPGGFADWLKANGYTEESFRVQTRSDLLGAAMRDLVTQDVGSKAEQVHLRQILVDTEAEARSILDQLRQGSVTFDALAKKYSQDEASRNSGGDLGFMPRGLLDENVEEAAFAMKPGQISDPVQSSFGWHILHLVERDPAREIPPDMLATLRQEAFMRWLDGERDKAQIQRLITP